MYVLLCLYLGHPYKKKFVSCPAGGLNCGQSGGRKIVFFSVFFFLFWGEENDEILTHPPPKKMAKWQKKSSHSAVIYTPGRWTGNKFFLRVALVFLFF